MPRLFIPSLVIAVLLTSAFRRGGADDAPAAAVPTPAQSDVTFDMADGALVARVGADVVATYVFKDTVTTRPHFRNLHAPGGALVTRAHPPVEGRDPTDHADMHPGAWLAFADVSGLDVWRNKAKVEHVRFVDEPAGGPDRGTFAVVNRYTDGTRVVCEETCRYTLLVRPGGYLLVADSAFRVADGDLSFGDQEEMGFGVRVATPLAVKSGGQIVDSEGRENEAGIWGKPAAWVDYSGTVNGRRGGVMLIPDPANAHAARFHVRDYGLMVANPFGRKVFGEKDESRVVVPKGGSYRMRFAVLLHANSPNAIPDLKAAYEDCLRCFRDEARP